MYIPMRIVNTVHSRLSASGLFALRIIRCPLRNRLHRVQKIYIASFHYKLL